MKRRTGKLLLRQVTPNSQNWSYNSMSRFRGPSFLGLARSEQASSNLPIITLLLPTFHHPLDLFSIDTFKNDYQSLVYG